MQQQIENALQPLLGQPLLDAGRAGGLLWLHFGEKHVVPARNGQLKGVGDYALHVQCVWRLRDLNTIIVASADLRYPAGNEANHNDGVFDWDRPGANRSDERLAAFLAAHADAPLLVTHFVADELGGIQLLFGSIYTLEVFPDNTLPGEYWRLFHPGRSHSEEHFVVTGVGIDS